MNINITFWHNHEAVFSTWVESFPNYQIGQEIYLSSSVTPIGEKKFSSAEHFRGKFEIESITHIIERTYSDDISDFFKVEVQLKQK